jgi:hypothetical protein
MVDIGRGVLRIGSNIQVCVCFRLSIAAATESRNKAMLNIRIEAGLEMSCIFYVTKDTKAQSLCTCSNRYIMKNLVHWRTFMKLCVCYHDKTNFCYSSDNLQSFHF